MIYENKALRWVDRSLKASSAYPKFVQLGLVIDS